MRAAAGAVLLMGISVGKELVVDFNVAHLLIAHLALPGSHMTSAEVLLSC